MIAPIVQHDDTLLERVITVCAGLMIVTAAMAWLASRFAA